MPGSTAPRVIASSRDTPALVTSDLPLPDDGLSAYVPRKSATVFPKTDATVRLASLGLPSSSLEPARSTGPTPSVQTAAVAVGVVEPNPARPGQPRRFQLLVRNAGSVDVARVRLEQELPAGTRLLFADPPPETKASRLVWNVGNLEARAERLLTVEVQPDDAGELVVAPMVSYATTFGTHKGDNAPSLSITQVVPETVRRNGTVLIRLRVANAGRQPLRHVKVIDQLPPGLEHLQGSRLETDLGTLEPGQNREVRLEAGAARSGRLTNEAVVLADGGLRVPSQSVVEVVEPSLSVRINGPAHAKASEELELSVEANNPGPATATGAAVLVTLPPGFEFVVAGMEGKPDMAGRHVGWTLGALAAGQTWSANLRLRARQGGDWTCLAQVTADHLAAGRAEHRAQITGGSALTMELLEQGPAVEVGNELAYDIVVMNPGSAAIDNVRLSVKAGDGLALVGPSGPATGDGRQVRFEPLPHLGPHDRKLYHIQARGLRPGDWNIRAELSADQKPPLVQEVRTRVIPSGGR
jgi:hypothetical protein